LAQEEIDSITVFENSNFTLLSKIIDHASPPIKTTNLKSEILIDNVANYMDEHFGQTPSAPNLYLFMAIKKYLQNEKDAGVTSFNYNKYTKDNIIKICFEIIKDNNKYTRKIIDEKLPICFYTYRQNKKRIGVAIDKNVLPATQHANAGFGRNFKTYNDYVKIDLLDDNRIDLTTFVKDIVFWSSKNSKLHGFDKKTGIVWFNGASVDDCWVLPNGFKIKDNSMALVNIICASDAFSKMIHRFHIDALIDKMISELKHNF